MISQCSHKYRSTLRVQLENLKWQNTSWAPGILAAEVVQGWAGRKQNRFPTAQLRVYHTRKWNRNNISDFGNFMAQIVLPGPTIIVPIRWMIVLQRQNRVPLTDTQDRFWILRDTSYIDIRHWNHWSLTKEGWGIFFKPTENEAKKIYECDILFNSAMSQENYSTCENGEGPYWVQVVQKYAHIWPSYAAIVHLNRESIEKTITGDMSSYINLMCDLRNIARDPYDLSKKESWPLTILQPD